MSFEKEHFQPCLFVHIPRTGGTAAKHASPFINFSYANYIGEHYTYLSYKKYLESNNSKLSNYSTFSIIRNPLERLVSLWCSNNWGYIKDAEILRNIIGRPEGYSIPFKDYVMNLQNIEDNYEPRSIDSDQYLNSANSFDLLKNEDEKISIDFLLYNKTLHEDIVTLLNKFKNTGYNYTTKDVTMPERGSHNANATTPSDKSYLDFYDEESLSVAMKYYEKDFDYFDTSRW